MSPRSERPSPVPTPSTLTLFCRALYNYEAQDPASCLSFRRNDVIEVFTQAPSGWWDGRIAMPPDDDKRGWFPSNYVVVISDEEAELAFSGFDLDRPETNVADMEFGRLQGRELANAVPSPRIADFWIPEVSSDGRIYYVNTKTGQHAQDIPDEGNVDVDIGMESALGRGKGRAESSSPSGSKSYPSKAYPPIGDMIVSPHSPSFEEEHLDVSPPLYEKVETNAGSSAQTIVGPTRTTSMGRLARDMPPPPESPPQSYQQATYSRPTEIITDPEGTVRAGTLPALVERLTTHERADQTFIKSFLMTFKSFTTVDGLFDLLVQRFWIQPLPTTTAAEREEWRRWKQHVIQVRVLNTLRYLVVDDDVLEKADLGILDRMKEFIAIEEVARFPAAKQLWTLIERARQGDSLIKMVAATQGAPPSPLVLRSNKKLKLLDIEPLELARQLTIMESRLYQRIRPVDCLQRIWGQQTENTNNITVFIQTSEKIPIWVAESILSEDDSRRRARTIGHFISVADHCRNLKNFSAMARITLGLSTLVGRLTRTWAQVNPRSITQFSACRTAFSDYRSLMDSVIPPCVPFLEVSVSSLPDNVPAPSDKESVGDTLDLINFEKRQKAADVVHDIKRWQVPFNLHVIPSIQAHIEDCLNSVSDTGDTRERLDAISLELEPRGQEGEMMTRLLQESGLESPSSDDSLASPLEAGTSSLESSQPPHNDRQPLSVTSDIEKSLLKPSAEPIIVTPGSVFPSTASTSFRYLPPPLWERDKTSGIFPGLNPTKSGGNTNSGSPTLQPEDIGISDGHGTAVDVEPGTFFIYTPRDDRPGTPPTSFTTDDLACVQANFGSGGCLMSIHEPVEAVSWIEDNWNSSLLTSIRNSGCSGPFAWMLSPTQPAFAIFGSHNEAVVVNMVQTLAHSSGFPVVIRSTSDNPALTLLGDEPGLHNIPVDSSSINGSPDRASGGTNDGAQNTSGNTGAGGNGSQNRTSGTGGDGDEGPNRRGPGVGGNGGGGDRSTSRSENDRLSFNQEVNFSGGDDGGGGGDDGGPTMVDGKWASPLHRTRVELSLKLNAGHTYAVNIGYTFKFTINRETEIPIDLGDLTRPLSQSEVVALVDLKVETRQRETQVDRSYASIGFISHRKKSIIDREFLPRGFDLPGRVYKHGQQQQIQRGVKAVLGFSQGSPLATAGFSYNRNNDTSLEATDTKAMPNCCVVAEPGETWNEDKKSYSSYNISYWAQAMQLDAKRPEFLPIEVKVGMGINLRPPSSETPLPQISFVNRNQVLVWVSDTTLKSRIRGIVVLMSNYLNDIWTEPKLSIYEQGEVELGAGFSNTARFKTENQEPGTISLSVAQVEKQSATGSRKLRAGVPSFFTKRSQHTSVKDLASIPTHEYLARGWDVHNDEWRKVVWPALDKDFLAPGPEKTPLVWKIQCPWDRDQRRDTEKGNQDVSKMG